MHTAGVLDKSMAFQTSCFGIHLQQVLVLQFMLHSNNLHRKFRAQVLQNHIYSIQNQNVIQLAKSISKYLRKQIWEKIQKKQRCGLDD